MLRRLFSLRERLCLDAVLVTSPSNIKFYTGVSISTYERPLILLVGREGVLIVAPRLEAGRLDVLGFADTVLYDDGEDPWVLLAEKTRALIGDKFSLGIEYVLPYSLFSRIVSLIKPERTVDITQYIAEERVRKTPEMINAIERANSIIEEIFEGLRERIRPGTNEREISLWITGKAEELGSDSVLFAAVQSGPNSAIPHHERSSRTLRQGDVVVVDIALSYKGYYGDLTRVFFLGKPEYTVLSHYMLLEETVASIIDKLEPDLPCSEADLEARRRLGAEGLLEYFIHRTGHGLGVEVHEPPYLSPGSKDWCAVGSVFTVEPGLYFPRRYGLRIERDIAMTTKGPRILDDYPVEPIIV